MLIVDDDPGVRQSLRLCLEAGGARVFGVGTSSGAVEAVERGHYDVVLTDDCVSLESATAALALQDLIGDLDRDGDVDLRDFTAFVLLFRGPGNPVPAAWAAYLDFDGDTDIDLADFAVFQQVFTGPR